jgi:hypothetical protein
MTVSHGWRGPLQVAVSAAASAAQQATLQAIVAYGFHPVSGRREITHDQFGRTLGDSSKACGTRQTNFRPSRVFWRSPPAAHCCLVRLWLEVAWSQRLSPRRFLFPAFFAAKGGDPGTYKRPSNATTPEQRASVQGKPCATCGKDAPRMNADHVDPLVEQHYRNNGQIELTNMRDVSSVQPQCPTCSNRQGGFLSGFGRAMRSLFGL